MFGLGATELIVILVLALILLGPKKLPDVAAGLGKAIRQFRKATRDLTSQLDIDDDVKQPFRELRAAIRDEPAPYVPPPVRPAVTAPAPDAVPTAAPVVAALGAVAPPEAARLEPSALEPVADAAESSPATPPVPAIKGS